MMKHPRVTVGLPVYNGQDFLAAAIDSIVAQDFTDFELLVADNGSTDGTPAIARAAAARDARVAVHRSQTNRGAAWNYNRCVQMARGEYFKWAAHDDLLESQFVRRCVEVLDARPDVVLCYSQVADIDAGDQVIHHWDMPTYATEEKPSQRLWRVLLKPSFCFETFGLARRDTLLKTGCIGPYTSSDRTLLLELALLGRFYEIPERLLRHRQHAGRSTSAYADAHARNIWFDPERSGKITAPRWRLLYEYARAIARAPIPVHERLAAFKALRWWLHEHRKALRQDLLAITKGQAKAVALLPSADK